MPDARGLGYHVSHFASHQEFGPVMRIFGLFPSCSSSWQSSASSSVPSSSRRSTSRSRQPARRPRRVSRTGRRRPAATSTSIISTKASCSTRSRASRIASTRCSRKTRKTSLPRQQTRPPILPRQPRRTRSQTSNAHGYDHARGYGDGRAHAFGPRRSSLRQACRVVLPWCRAAHRQSSESPCSAPS